MLWIYEFKAVLKVTTKSTHLLCQIGEQNPDNVSPAEKDTNVSKSDQIKT